MRAFKKKLHSRNDPRSQSGVLRQPELAQLELTTARGGLITKACAGARMAALFETTGRRTATRRLVEHRRARHRLQQIRRRRNGSASWQSHAERVLRRRSNRRNSAVHREHAISTSQSETTRAPREVLRPWRE